MQEVIKAMCSRRSCRNYLPDPVPQEKLDAILEAGMYAPTGRNMQSPIIIAITNKEKRDALSRLNGFFMGMDEDFDPFYGAPVVLCVLADKTVPTYLYDGSEVMSNLQLAAHAEGLGSCWIHRAKEEFETDEGKELLRSLGITGEYEGIGHCVVGYAAEPPEEPKPRKTEYVYWVK